MKIDLDYVGIASRLPVSVRRPIGLGSKNGGGFVRFDGGVPDRLNHQARSFPNLAPGTPALDNAVIWGCFDSTEQAHMSQWRSEPFVTDRSEWLKISVAGDLGRPGTHLELRDAATGQTAGTIVPDRSAGHTWRSAWVLAPAGRWVLAAENPGAAIWFAFSQPTEMSRGSHLAWQLARHGTWLAWGAGLLALGMLAGLRFSR